MTTAPKNETFKKLFLQAREAENLHLLKELQEIGKTAMDWNNAANIYSNGASGVSEDVYSRSAITGISIKYYGNKEVSLSIATIDGADHYNRASTFYGLTVNENDALVGKPFSVEGWKAFVALFKEWVNNGKIETVQE